MASGNSAVEARSDLPAIWEFFRAVSGVIGILALCTMVAMLAVLEQREPLHLANPASVEDRQQTTDLRRSQARDAYAPDPNPMKGQDLPSLVVYLVDTEEAAAEVWKNLGRLDLERQMSSNSSESVDARVYVISSMEQEQEAGLSLLRALQDRGGEGELAIHDLR